MICLAAPGRRIVTVVFEAPPQLKFDPLEVELFESEAGHSQLVHRWRKCLFPAGRVFPRHSPEAETAGETAPLGLLECPAINELFVVKLRCGLTIPVFGDLYLIVQPS